MALPVAKAQTVDEWELGIPPLDHNKFSSNFLLRQASINNFKTCATNQAINAAHKSRLAKIACQISINYSLQNCYFLAQLNYYQASKQPNQLPRTN